MAEDNIEKMIRSHLVRVDTYDAMDAPETLAEESGIAPVNIIKLNGNGNHSHSTQVWERKI